MVTRAEYIRLFPGYCRKCEGWGIHKSFSPTVQIWECACMTANNCPRCGAEGMLSLGTCPVCDWNMDDKERGVPGSNFV
jgi:hypothetical protein